MERKQWEKDMGEILRHRRIEPSEDAWKRLESQLPSVAKDTEDSSERKRPIWLWVAAAAVIGIAVSGLWYFNGSATSEVLQPQTPVVLPKGGAQPVDVFREVAPLPIKTAEVLVVAPVPSAPEITEMKAEVVVFSNKTEITSLTSEEQNNESAKLDTEVSEVVQKLTEMIPSGEALAKLSAQEADALLAEALRQLDAPGETYKTDSLATPSAAALLAEVESDIDKGFKEKVFDALQQGFQKLKTSVAENRP